MLALVAEDNEDYRQLITLLLERHGFEVVSVENGREALSAISDILIAGKQPPQVMFLDWTMPGINGLQVLQRVRKLPGDAKHAYIVILTGHDEEQLVAEAANAGADDFIVKNHGAKLLDIKLNAAVRFAKLFEQHHCTA